jgi:rubrerythrin
MGAWDLSKFKLEDVFQLAVSVEQGGYDFYQKLIEQSDSQRAKNEMKYLRDEEAKHKAFFSSKLEAKKASGQGMGLEAKSLLDKEFLTPMAEMYKSKKITKNDEALRFGMQLEQKTIDLYEGLKKVQSDSGFLKDLDAVIEEEKKHKATLNLILAY